MSTENHARTHRRIEAPRRFACLAPCVPLIATMLLSAPAAAQDTLIALTAAGELRRFSSATPGTIDATLTITGLSAGDSLVGIDVRPATGQLYGVSVQSRVYVIDMVTGAATLVSATPFAATLTGTSFGFDFTPVVDRMRIVADDEQNIRVNPTSAALSGVDINLSPDGEVVAIAYANNAVGATTTTLFGIDTISDALVRIGGVNGSPSPNGGVVTGIGILGLNADALAGFDIAASGAAYAMLNVAAVSQLHTVNLSTGAATLVGTIGGSGMSIGLAAVLPPAITIDDVTMAEGDSGTSTATFTAALAWPTPATVTVNYQTADGTATAGSDYTTASGMLTFAPGATTATLGVTVSGDTTIEPTEAFTVGLSGAVNATIADTQGSATLTNDETDTDGDGAADSVDGCPSDAAKIAAGCAGCGLLDPDGDGDGRADCVDNCPAVSNADQADADSNGAGDACPPDADSNGTDDAGPPDAAAMCGIGVCGAGAAPALGTLLLVMLIRPRRQGAPRSRL